MHYFSIPDTNYLFKSIWSTIGGIKFGISCPIKAIQILNMYNLVMKKIPLFFKPVFYRLDTNSILFHYDELLELFRIPQFIIKKEIISDKDLEIAMGKISEDIKECGIINYGKPYAKTSIKILEGLEEIFFFSVKVEPILRMPENIFWLKYDDVIKENDEIAWWDQNAIMTYIPNPKLPN